MSSSRSHSVWCLKCSLVICSVCVFFSSWVTLTCRNWKELVIYSSLCSADMLLIFQFTFIRREPNTFVLYINNSSGFFPPQWPCQPTPVRWNVAWNHQRSNTSVTDAASLSRLSSDYSWINCLAYEIKNSQRWTWIFTDFILEPKVASWNVLFQSRVKDIHFKAPIFSFHLSIWSFDIQGYLRICSTKNPLNEILPPALRPLTGALVRTGQLCRLSALMLSQY